MASGKIVEIVLESGFGFIEAEKDPRIFFHQRWLSGVEFKDLKVGDEVVFNFDKGPRGIRARDVALAAGLDPAKKMLYEAGDIAFQNRLQSYRMPRGAARPPRTEGSSASAPRSDYRPASSSRGYGGPRRDSRSGGSRSSGSGSSSGGSRSGGSSGGSRDFRRRDNRTPYSPSHPASSNPFPKSGPSESTAGSDQSGASATGESTSSWKKKILSIFKD